MRTILVWGVAALTALASVWKAGAAEDARIEYARTGLKKTTRAAEFRIPKKSL